MKTFYLMLIRIFVPIFLVTLAFLILIFEFMDLFQNIWRYVNNKTSLQEILNIMLYYLPKCLSYSLPLGFLFSITFTLGNMYTYNELIAVFGAGISLYRFTFPFIVIGLLICLFYFVFDDMVVIKSYTLKNQYQSTVLKQVESFSNNNIAIKTADNKVIYQARIYNSKENILTDVNLIEKDNDGNLIRIIKAQDGKWNGTNWSFSECRVFAWNEDHSFFQESYMTVYDDKKLNEDPSNLSRICVKPVGRIIRS